MASPVRWSCRFDKRSERRVAWSSGCIYTCVCHCRAREPVCTVLLSSQEIEDREGLDTALLTSTVRFGQALERERILGARFAMPSGLRKRAALRSPPELWMRRPSLSATIGTMRSYYSPSTARLRSVRFHRRMRCGKNIHENGCAAGVQLSVRCTTRLALPCRVHRQANLLPVALRAASHVGDKRRRAGHPTPPP